MKKIFALILALLTLSALAGCSQSGRLTIAVPHDTTNEARALLLLEANGIITLAEDAGITATVQDIQDNPHNITFQEVEAAQLPNILPDVDYAVINSNYAIDAGIDPITESLVMEGAASAYVNAPGGEGGQRNRTEDSGPEGCPGEPAGGGLHR